MLAVTPVILPPSFTTPGEPVPTTYVVDSSLTNKLVKRNTSKPIRFQGTVVVLVGVGCSIASGGVPPSADWKLGQSKNPSLGEWVGGGLGGPERATNLTQGCVCVWGGGGGELGQPSFLVR